jgi:hypothetical protein
MASMKRLDVSPVAITLRFSSLMGTTLAGLGKKGLGMVTA